MSLERSAATPFWSDPSALRASLLDTYPALKSASAAGYFPPRKVLNAPGQRLQDLPRPMGHRIRRPLDLPRPMGHRIRRRLDQLRRKPRLRVARNLQRLRTAAHPLRPMEAAALLIEQLRVVSLKAGQFGPLFFLSPIGSLWHLSLARRFHMLPYTLRAPVEPSPTPVQDPIDPPENPDVPVREPEPDDPNQI